MRDFEFYNPTRIIFGKSSENNLLYELRKYGKRILFVYGGGSIKKSGLYEVVSQQIREANALCFELGGVQSNPKVSLVRKGIELARKQNIDFILAVGGGSVIDTAKAISAGVFMDCDIWDAYVTKVNITRAIPLGVVLTIAGAGSESSTGSVLTNDENGLKRSIHSEAIIPKFAILNPCRTFTLPPYQTACGACDIIAHLLERYFTPDKDVELIDRMIEAAIKTMLIYAPKAIATPNDYDARSQIMWCGTLAHNDLLSTGRLGDWGSHKIGHELSAFNDVAHGASLSIVFPAWMKFTYEKNKERFVNLATRAFDIEKGDKLDEQIIFEMIAKFEAFLKKLGLPTHLREINI
ncbi:MAG: iron-containing alcohol dehydrogenase, partial [Clostridia bacterium]